MGRKSTGTVRILKNEQGKPQWHAKWTFADGKRSKWEAIDGVRLDDEAGAKACAARLAVKVRKGSTPGASAVETVAEYAARWLDDRECRVNSVRDDRGRLRMHVLPTLGPLDAAQFTRDDVERLRDELDKKIVKGELAWKTVASVWTLVTSMCADMVNAKKREFRTRADNPCRDVKPTDRGARKAKQYLYPSEFLQFVACERVPLRWRRAVALAIYTYTRDAELRVLRWPDIDHGIVDITRAFNRRKPGEVKGTKSDAPRRFAVEANLLPLLEAMRPTDGQGLVANLPSERAMARNLRRWLVKAGVNRPALHERTPTSQHLTWHDLRATGATWMAVRGDDAHKIMQRCGHKSFSTTMLYVREGEAIREGFGDPFPPLPDALLGIAPESPRAIFLSENSVKTWTCSGVDGTRTRGLRRDRPAL
jgi:integrase